MAKKVTTEEVVEAINLKEVSQSTEEASIEITTDYLKLKSGDVHQVSLNVAEVLIAKGVAKLTK